jgi:hypothetical protein
VIADQRLDRFVAAIQFLHDINVLAALAFSAEVILSIWPHSMTRGGPYYLNSCPVPSMPFGLDLREA